VMTMTPPVMTMTPPVMTMTPPVMTMTPLKRPHPLPTLMEMVTQRTSTVTT